MIHFILYLTVALSSPRAARLDVPGGLRWSAEPEPGSAGTGDGLLPGLQRLWRSALRRLVTRGRDFREKRGG